MGTFVDYNGSMEIPEKKREEFLFRVQKIAELGGLMKLKKVSIHEREVLLLRPLELSKNGVAAGTTTFNFSYFEDDAWETARFLGKDLYLCSEKVGEREFYDAMIALYSLYTEPNDYAMDMCFQTGFAVPDKCPICKIYMNTKSVI